MIIIFLCMWLVGWSLAPLLRCAAAGRAQTTTVATGEKRSAVIPPPTSLEDDPARWRPADIRGDWTALDEHQLIRLLTDSAS